MAGSATENVTQLSLASERMALSVSFSKVSISYSNLHSNMVIIFGIQFAKCLCCTVVKNIDRKFYTMNKVHQRHIQTMDRSVMTQDQRNVVTFPQKN